MSPIRIWSDLAFRLRISVKRMRLSHHCDVSKHGWNKGEMSQRTSVNGQVKKKNGKKSENKGSLIANGADLN